MKLYEELVKIAGDENVLCQEPMKKHTTFRIGGPADYFVIPHTAEEVAELIRVCKKQQVSWYILGNGSNLLVSDQGFRGVIIQLFRNFNGIVIEGERVQVQAGAMNSVIAKRVLEAELTGFEFAAGIPGTMGGAVVMNAGAYGGEMKDILEEVTVLDENENLQVLPKEALKMGYRTSVIAEKNYVVLSAVLNLKKGNAVEIRSKMEELKEQRVSKQPLEYPSAGSTFKRPEGYFAGKLIMDAGLRGFTVGQAQVSEKHCGFVINKGEATAKDVTELMREVSRQVKEKFGVELESEVKRLGECD